jgi:4-diphosphocytidyl-2C-methyl-D-erythritol kinase
VLTTLNNLFKLNLSEEEMLKIALRVGADVPFFVKCKPARVRGIGEHITPITLSKNYNIIIVKPKNGLSTQNVFQKADTMELKVCDIESVIKALETGDDDLLAKSVGNSLQEPAIALLPEINEVIRELQGFGLKIVQMSGSGSAVFGISNDLKLLKKIESKLEDKYVVEITKIINK